MPAMKIDDTPDHQLASFERLLDQKEHLLANFAGLWARYGPQGVAAVLRNRHFAVLKGSIRQKDTGATETALKEAVERSPQWGTFLAQLEEGRNDYIATKFAIDMINARIQLSTTRLRLIGISLSLPVADDTDEAEDGEA
jgi:hypothetical protein